jgi:hypothetical protein
MLMSNRISNSEQLAFLMESVASSHVFMDTQQTYEATRLVVESLRLEEVNAVATEICEHITLYGQPGAPQPSAVVACVPSKSSQGGAQVCISRTLHTTVLCYHFVYAFSKGSRIFNTIAVTYIAPKKLYCTREAHTLLWSLLQCSQFGTISRYTMCEAHALWSFSNNSNTHRTTAITTTTICFTVTATATANRWSSPRSC